MNRVTGLKNETYCTHSSYYKLWPFLGRLQRNKDIDQGMRRWEKLILFMLITSKYLDGLGSEQKTRSSPTSYYYGDSSAQTDELDHYAYTDTLTMVTGLILRGTGRSSPLL